MKNIFTWCKTPDCHVFHQHFRYIDLLFSGLHIPKEKFVFGRRKWQPTPVFLPGKSHGQRSLVGYSLWGRKNQTWQRNHHHHVYSVSVFSLNEYFSLPLVLSNLMCIHVILLTFLKFGFFELLRSVSLHCIWNAFIHYFLKHVFCFLPPSRIPVTHVFSWLKCLHWYSVHFFQSLLFHFGEFR